TRSRYVRNASTSAAVRPLGWARSNASTCAARVPRLGCTRSCAAWLVVGSVSRATGGNAPSKAKCITSSGGGRRLATAQLPVCAVNGAGLTTNAEELARQLTRLPALNL